MGKNGSGKSTFAKVSFEFFWVTIALLVKALINELITVGSSWA